MDKSNKAASPIVGPTNNVSAKLKAGSFSDSPSNINCQSPHQNIGINNSSMSPYTAFNPDSKAEDVVLPKNGSSTCVRHAGQSPNSFLNNDNCSLPDVCSSPSTSAPISAQSHCNSLPKRPFNKFGDGGSPGDAISVRSRPDRAPLHNAEPTSHNLLSRSLSVNSSMSNKAPPNSANPNLARRMYSVDSGNLNKDGLNPSGGMNASKLPEKSSLRHSPRATGDFANSETRSRNDNNSPFSSSSASFNESAMDQNPSKAKLKTEVRLNHQVTRASSANSVSDLSPCSEVTDENASAKQLANKNSSHMKPSTSNPSYSNECNNNPNSSIADITIDNSLLASLGDDIDNIPDNMTLDSFPFSSTGNGGGSNPPDLSADEVQEALNSVSENSLNINLANVNNGNLPSHSDLGTRLPTEVLSENNVDFGTCPTSEKLELDILSPASVSTSLATSTTDTAAVAATSDASTSKLATLSMESMSAPLTNKNASSANAGHPSSVAHSSTVSSGTTKSHLQEILGAADTNRLKNMARPVDASQYQPPSSTSYASTFNNQAKANPYTSQIPPANDRTIHPLQLSSPQGISPRHKFASGNSFQRTLHRTPSNPHSLPGSSMQEYDINQVDLPSKVVEHPMARTPYDQSKMAGGPHSVPPPGNMHPYSISPQPAPGNPSWQRQSSVGGMLPSHAMPVSLNEGSQSPRGPMSGNFPPRSINPMSGLQSTVDAIPNLNCLTKNNSNMGPPHSNHRVPTPGESCMSVPSSTMRPPPSPHPHDKRSVSADGSVAISSNLKKNSVKRERGQSLDSKDGDKKEPKTKRRKSKSKDESKKLDSRLGGRASIGGDVKYFIFNTDLANCAASNVMNHSYPSIIHHHNSCQDNARLLPSKSSTFPSCPIKAEHNSPHNSSAPSGGVNTKSHPQPAVASGTDAVKTEAGVALTPQIKTETKANNSTSIKTESDVFADQLAPNVSSSPSLQPDKESQKALTDEQLRHREESLGKLEAIRSKFLPEQKPAPSNTSSWQNPTSGNPPRKPNNYSMSIHLQKVRESTKDNTSTESEWFRLVQAYNIEKRSRRQNHHNVEDPPPYNSANPSFPQRWMSPGHPIRESGAPTEIPNPRFPHHPSASVRMPHDGPRLPVSYVRGPRGYMVPVGPNHRMPIYPGSTVPGGVVPRGQMSRLPQSSLTSNEAYPFSEKLKEQASMYRSEGPHSQAGGLGFDPANPTEPMSGPRMGSPEWAPYGNPSSHRQLMLSGGIPNQGMDPVPSVDPSLDPNLAMQMNNPGLGSSYSMNSFVNKGTGGHSPYPASSMGGLPSLSKSFSNQVMRGDGVPGMHHDRSHPAGMMGDTMTRRGEPRPPDLNINPALARSGSPFHGARHPMPSPGMNNPTMMTSQFMPGDPVPHVQSGLPQMSPHPSNISRSPMVNSPNLMKSPMGNQIPYAAMGQGGSIQSLDQGSMLQGGPRSAGPAGVGPVEWNAMSQPSGVQSARAQSSGQKAPLQQMIDDVNRFQLPNTLYRNEVKDNASPPPLSHMMENPGMPPQEPPPLSHNPSGMEGTNMPVTPGSNPIMIRHPQQGGLAGFDSGPRSAGARMIGPSAMGDTYGREFNRPPSHSEMCMSPVPNPQGMMQPGMLGIHNSAGPYISQSNMMPPSDNPSGPAHSGCNPGSNLQRIPQFDLSGILPSEKPSQTLSYFPSEGGSIQDASQMEPTSNMAMPMRSPPMTQQSVNRYSSISINPRPSPPGGYPGSNPPVRMPGHGNFAGLNPPGYPGPTAGEGFMSQSWEGMPRPQGMPGGVHNMHFQPNPPLI